MFNLFFVSTDSTTDSVMFIVSTILGILVIANKQTNASKKAKIQPFLQNKSEKCPESTFFGFKVTIKTSPNFVLTQFFQFPKTQVVLDIRRNCEKIPK